MKFESVKDIFERENLETLVILIYELDDSALFDVCLAGSQAITNLSSVKPVIFYDARKTNETFSAPPVVELIPYRKAGGKHHSKAYLFSSLDEVHLIFGSLNLTKAGLLRNKEVFKHFKWNGKDVENLGILKDFISLLENHYTENESDNLNESLSIIKEIIKDFDSANSTYYLIQSGYKFNGLKQLQQIWSNKYPDTHPGQIYSISPFFDAGGDNLIKRLDKEGLGAKAIDLITSRGRREKIPITVDYFAESSKNYDLRVFESDYKIYPGSKEWQFIKKHEQKAGINIKDDKEFFRNLHAKIHVFSGDNSSLLYFGSANFTLNAWTGKNCELGLASWVDEDIGNIINSLADVYNVGKTPVSNDAFSQEIEMDDTGDDLEKLKDFPVFIKSIQLIKVGDDKVRFNFRVDSKNNCLDQYKITWGDYAIQINALVSQEFDLTTCMNLFLKRSLKFEHLRSKRVYFYPYIFNSEITDIVKISELGGSCGYIEAFIGDTGLDYETEILSEMYGDNENNEEIYSLVDRENNLTIKMQRFTSLLPYLEEKINSLLKELRTDKVLIDINIKRYLYNPINEIISVMEQEYNADKSAASIIYKLAELYLIVKSQNSKELNEINDLIADKLSHYQELKKTDSNIFMEYLAYVRS